MNGSAESLIAMLQMQGVNIAFTEVTNFIKNFNITEHREVDLITLLALVILEIQPQWKDLPDSYRTSYLIKITQKALIKILHEMTNRKIKS